MVHQRDRADALGQLVRATFASARLSELTDGELLARFVAARDEEAFAELVRRLGPTVYGACRAILGNVEDAEDAFQVAFLVLARKAAAVRPPGRVAAWLHGVAVLAARKARAARARRAVHEARAAAPADRAAPCEAADPDLAAVLHEELGCLPEKYRLAVVLCELRELTIEQAAAELGWPAGTVASRLSRGRQLLAARLDRRGLAAAGAALCQFGTAAPQARLVGASVSAACAGGASPLAVSPLMCEVLRAMNTTKIRVLLLGLIATAAVALGGAGALRPVTAAPAPAPAPAAPTAESDPLDRVKAANLWPMLEVPAVEKELGLTDAQKKKIGDARAKMLTEVGGAVKKHIADFAKAIQAAGPGGLPGGAPMAIELDELAQKEVEAFDKAVAGTLRPEQVRRLKQVSLQVMGPAALLDRRVVRALALTADQEDRIDAILPGMPAPPRPVCGPNGCKVPEASPKEIEKIDAVWAAALKVLTADQWAKWDVLSGKRLPSADLQKVHRVNPLERLNIADLLPADLVPPGGLPPGN